MKAERQKHELMQNKNGIKLMQYEGWEIKTILS